MRVDVHAQSATEWITSQTFRVIDNELMPSIVNIAAYKFVPLANLGELRRELRELCGREQLKGTILLSEEGINCFVAGGRSNIDSLLSFLQDRPEFTDLPIKKSYSTEQPFNRMLVKIKKEIIAFGVPGIAPAQYTSKRITAAELKQWLDEGRPFTLLDTRNDYEVQAGTFNNAVAIGVDNFTDFPAAAKNLPDAMKEQPVVTFCTGGIRCEKAGPMLEQEGFTNVFQLDGGILKYFEECGGEHYQGDCFVFDKRVALDPNLQASGLALCFVCQSILSPEQQASPKFVEGVSCPHCFVEPADQLNDKLKERQSALQAIIQPLPGSVPYDNVRPVRVPQKSEGMSAIDFLDSLFTQLTHEEWIADFERGRIKIKEQTIAADHIVKAGDRLLHSMPGTIEPAVNADIRFVYEDEAIVVVEKPAPLPMHACGRFHRNTLGYLLQQIYSPLQLRPAHRLDADTSGIVLFCKTRKYARLVQKQFAEGAIEKHYLAGVHGTFEETQWQIESAISNKPGQGGVRLPDAGGQPATTRFRVMSQREGKTLLEVEPLTGRTNQIRIHLWEMGSPIINDPVYLLEMKLGPPRSLAVGDTPMQLHAWSISFQHPLTDEQVRFEASKPAWAT